MDTKDVKKQILGTERHDMDSLLRIIACLRGEDGCPWDRVQTHKTIRGDLIEETYEVVEAIDNDDPELLREELGFEGPPHDRTFFMEVRVNGDSLAQGAGRSKHAAQQEDAEAALARITGKDTQETQDAPEAN